MKLAQHGFARNEVWEFDSIVTDNDEGVSVRLSKYCLIGFVSFDIFPPSA
jgi:D-hexose-6-phosphate mutarotase